MTADNHGHRALSDISRLAPPAGLSDWAQPGKWVTAALRSPLGRLAVNPWLEGPGVWAIGALYLPLSRLWAAASVAEGDVDRFFNEVPLDDVSAPIRALTGPMLARHERVRSAAIDANAAWEEAFFGAKHRDETELATTEQRRLDLAQRYMLERLRFAYLNLRADVPPVRYETPTPDAFEALARPWLDEPATLFCPETPIPEIEVSRSVPSDAGLDYWLRFPSPSPRMPDLARARVHEPIGASNPPTLIFASGVCVDADQWRFVPHELIDLCRAGIRVIELEAPWHGRRSLPGRYGGEPFFARAPLGPIELFSAEVCEIGALIGWCRTRSTGRVAVAGASMGAIATMLVGGVAKSWCEDCRPDALMMMAFADDFAALAFDSAITQAARLPEALRGAGWDRAKLERYGALLAPPDRPAVSPDAIIAVLGRQDRITPFGMGRDLIERWGVPDGNVFIRDQGHLTLPADVARDDAPLQRLRQILLGERS